MKCVYLYIFTQYTLAYHLQINSNFSCRIFLFLERTYTYILYLAPVSRFAWASFESDATCNDLLKNEC